MIDTQQLIVDRLENWARWARVNATRCHCMSIEHRYKAPPCWEQEQPRHEVDILDAVIIEKIVVSLPSKNMQALKYAYILPWVPYWEQIRRIGCKSSNYLDTIHKAELMVRNATIRNA